MCQHGCGAFPISGEHLNLTNLETGVYAVRKDLFNWDNVNSFCASHDLQAITLNSQLEFNLISAQLSAEFWTSARYESGEFVWAENSVLLPINSTLWADAEPDDFLTSNRACVKASPELKLFDDDCRRPLWFACEMPESCYV
ncbi:P-selectin-like [Cloeon dipterum]|uniref:P-selectin-like n=1 Tax=Cloeon dipterum TaxID=197152 RepID=UPI00321F88CD